MHNVSGTLDKFIAIKSLEETLGKVDVLRGDLNAEIVDQERKTEIKQYRYPHSADNWNFFGGIDGEEEVQRRIAHPDIKKREEAKQEMRRIYETTQFLTVKYNIARSVEKYDQGQSGYWLPLPKFEEVIEEARKKLNNPGVHQLEMLCSLYDVEKFYWTGASGFENKDKMDELLRECYSSNINNEVRIEAGKALGYSQFRIWLHEKLR